MNDTKRKIGRDRSVTPRRPCCHDRAWLRTSGALRPRPQARPVERQVQEVRHGLSHILVGASANPARPVIRRITPSDLLACARARARRLRRNAEPRCLPLRDLSAARHLSGRRDDGLSDAAAGLSDCRRIRADRTACRDRALRAEPAPRSRPRQFRKSRVRRAAFALARRDRRARHSAHGDLSDLAGGCGGDLYRQFRLRGAGFDPPIRRQRVQHIRRMESHRRRHRRRLVYSP